MKIDRIWHCGVIKCLHKNTIHAGAFTTLRDGFPAFWTVYNCLVEFWRWKESLEDEPKAGSSTPAFWRKHWSCSPTGDRLSIKSWIQLAYCVLELRIFWTMNLTSQRFLLGGCHVFCHLINFLCKLITGSSVSKT